MGDENVRSMYTFTKIDTVKKETASIGGGLTFSSQAAFAVILIL
jgi:hypothetical protein